MKWWGYIFWTCIIMGLLFIVAIVFTGCMRKEVKQSKDNEPKKYFRIVQVDKDSIKTPSKIITNGK